ncbi:TagK domain-containing protein [Comamonas composti]|uniref:TagK domain-containing protein n=1 Tax=Comamonas composti TaxID=408558 RepID=UPI00146F9C8C|nr:TagK domain-containing protein [Comamonas composti]
MQETLTCAVNGVLLGPNNRQKLTDADRIQVGSLIFIMEMGKKSEIRKIDATNKANAISPELFENNNATPHKLSLSSSEPADNRIISSFDLADLELALSDASTVRSISNINIEKIESSSIDFSEKSKPNNQTVSENTEKSEETCSSENIDIEENIISSLHREYMDVLQDPRRLASQSEFFVHRQAIKDNGQSLQDLTRQASHYESLHELLQIDQTKQELTGELESLDDYEILRPDTKSNVMLLFAPDHLKNQSSTNDFSQDDPLTDLLSPELGKSASTRFKNLPILNQREHHSAVVGGLMDLHTGVKKDKQDR